MARLSRKHDALPWMKWYPDDWRSDNGIAMCSAEARGVWMEILMCMWTSNIRGVMVGDPVAPALAPATEPGFSVVAHGLAVAASDLLRIGGNGVVPLAAAVALDFLLDQEGI